MNFYHIVILKEKKNVKHYLFTQFKKINFITKCLIFNDELYNFNDNYIKLIRYYSYFDG